MRSWTLDALRPGMRADAALDRHRRFDRRRRLLERREELVGTRIDLPAARALDGGALDATELRQQRRVPIVELSQKRGRVLEIGHQQGDESPRQLPLWLQLRADEPDRDDPELLRCSEQPRAGPVTSGIVLEHDPVEPGKRIPNVRLVVDRQQPPTLRIDIRKRAVRQLRALVGPESCHPFDDRCAVSTFRLARGGLTPVHSRPGFRARGGRGGPRGPSRAAVPQPCDRRSAREADRDR